MKGKMMRIFTRNGYFYIDSQKDKARVRLATGLKVSVESKAFLAKKGVCELFLQDKLAALAKWRDYADSAWDKAQISKSEQVRAKLIKKGDERFFIVSIFEKFEREKSFLKQRTRGDCEFF